MSDNNAGYNDSDQDNYYASNNSAQADFGQFQDGRNQPAAQPYNPNPYASQQPAQPAQPFYGQPTYGQPDYTQSAQPPIISSRRSPDTSSPHTISHQSTRSRPTIRRPNSSPATVTRRSRRSSPACSACSSVASACITSIWDTPARPWLSCC